MITAIIGTGGIGSVIARQLASGGEALQLSSADHTSARRLAAEIGRGAVVAVDNRDSLRGADTVVFALRFTVLKDVIDEITDSLTDKLVVVPSNPVGLDAQGNVVRLLPEGQSSGEVVAGWLPAASRLAMAFGTMSADLFESSSNRSPKLAVLFYTDRRRPCRRGSRAVDPNRRLRADQGRRARTVQSTRGGRRPSRSRRRPRRGALIARWGLYPSPLEAVPLPLRMARSRRRSERVDRAVATRLPRALRHRNRLDVSLPRLEGRSTSAEANDAAKADVACCRVDGLALAGGGPVAEAVVRSAEV